MPTLAVTLRSVLGLRVCQTAYLTHLRQEAGTPRRTLAWAMIHHTIGNWWYLCHRHQPRRRQPLQQSRNPTP
jgi:hypothetical protein